MAALALGVPCQHTVPGVFALHATCSLLGTASECSSWHGQGVTGHPDGVWTTIEGAKHACGQLPGSLTAAV